MPKLRKHWATEKIGGKIYKLKDASSDKSEMEALAKKMREKGYSARIVKGTGVRGAKYTYALYIRRAKKR